MKIKRKIAISDFYGIGEHIYEDELGWREDMKIEAKSLVSKDIFMYFVSYVGLNLAFYYIDNDTFYGIHSEENPIVVKKLPREKCSKFIGLQCDGDTHYDGENIGVYEDAEKIWNEQLFGGKHLEEVLLRSYIVGLN